MNEADEQSIEEEVVGCDENDEGSDELMDYVDSEEEQ